MDEYNFETHYSVSLHLTSNETFIENKHITIGKRKRVKKNFKFFQT